MADSLSDALVQRLRERAQDPVGRSGTAALTAGAVPLGDLLAAEQARLAAQPPEFQREVAAYLGGVNSPLAGLMGSLGALLGGSALAPPPAGPAPAAATEAQVEVAEAALGFALPPALRRLYLEVADGGVGPGEGVYGLGSLVAKYREMTGEPVGPQEQEWPTDLLPIQGADWDLICIDRTSGRLVYWDLEELDDDEDLPPDNPTWAASFVAEADSLEAWLGSWVDCP